MSATNRAEEVFVKLFLSVFLSLQAFAQVIPLNEYSPTISLESRTLLKTLKKDRCEKVEWILSGYGPFLQDKRKVRVIGYISNEKEVGRSNVLIIPPTGGENRIDRSYGRRSCLKYKTHAFILNTFQGIEDDGIDLELHDRGALKYLYAQRHAYEFIKNNFNDSIVLLGTSLGAIQGAVLNGYEEFKRASLIVGGGGLADMIANSTQSNLIELKEKRFQASGLATMEEFELTYESNLEEAIKIDSGSFVSSLEAIPVYYVLGKKDKVVPYKNQKILIGERPHSETVVKIKNKGHLGVVLSSWIHRQDRILKFLFEIK